MAITFHDLKLPKELSKKKKLDLYKCWILDPIDKDSEQRKLELDWTLDRYGLSEKAAIALEINKIGFDTLIANADNLLDFFNGKTFVILKITLLNGVMDEAVIIPPENASAIDMDPHYDPYLGALNVTVRYRAEDMGIRHYLLTNIALEIDDNQIATVKDIELQEQIINKSK